jgi:glucose/arabinose dehydrogenase
MVKWHRRIGLISILAVTSGALAQLPADLALEDVASGVGRAIGVRHAGDGSGRLFVIDVDGAIRIKPASAPVLETPFLRISAAANPPPFGFGLGGEGGLLGLAFHPAYASNGYFFIHYTDANSDGVVARYRVSSNPNQADPDSVQVILRIDADTIYHKGGDLHFGPDSYLYISVGDGGGGLQVDTCRRGQTLGPADLAKNDGNHGDCLADQNFLGSGGNPDARALQAKILRIDIDATTPAGSNELCGSAGDGSAPYAIPAGNPYAGTAGGAGRCDETWSYGLRNPYRFSFDRLTGDLFIGDVGEGEMEEIDRQAGGAAGGANYGWSFCEGTMPAPVAGATCAGFQAPILVYTHDENGPPCSSVSGGFRYRGDIVGLRGYYIYADYCSGRVWFASSSGGQWSVVDSWTGPAFSYGGFGEDEAGNLYIANMDAGRILRFASSEVSDDLIFEHGFDPAD